MQSRVNQIAPLEKQVGDWNIWFLMTGRGWGKTRTGAEDIIRFACLNPNTTCAVVGPTYNEVRSIGFNGPSGIIKNLPQACQLNGKGFNVQRLELHLWNGSLIKGYSAEVYDSLRGPNFHRAWLDEIAAWQYPELAFDQVMLALRAKVGNQSAKCIITSTPRPSQLIKNIVRDENTYVTRGSTLENATNLDESAVKRMLRMYGGTNLGRQELYGELLDATEGALWSDAVIERNRVAKKDVPDLVRIVVAIDPANTSTAHAAETGIIVAGLGTDERLYVLDDVSLRSTPSGWASAAVKAYHQYSADKIVAEVNSGGEMIGQIITTIEKGIPYKAVTASRGKITRAEPIASLYENNWVKHVGLYRELEDQMTSYVAGGNKSPDRMDALVWALTELYNGEGDAYWRVN